MIAIILKKCNKMSNNKISCILCGVNSGKVSHMFYSVKKDFYICNICNGKLYHYNIPFQKNLSSPHAIYQGLIRYISGQDSALREFSVTLFKHMLLTTKQIDEVMAIKIKTNSLIMGSTGTGKTYLIEIASKLFKIPYTIVDATKLTASGYVGEDVDNMYSKLIKSAKGVVADAEVGIICMDEIDKLAKPKESYYKDIGGESIQYELLTDLNGTVKEVSIDGQRKPYSMRNTKISTKKILYVATGCFSGIENYLSNSNASSSLIPFNDNPNEDYSTKMRSALKKYGFIPEFLGRFGSIISLKDLVLEDMINIINHPEGKLFYYKKFMMQYNIQVDISDDAIVNMAKYAIRVGIGARGIDEVLEKLFNNLIFQIDKYRDSQICLVESDVEKVLNRKII